MPNQFISARLAGICTQLLGAHQASAPLSPATKGPEREQFVEQFLCKVMPTPYRFGTGDATDMAGRKTGQLDVVVEYPFLPSLPAVGSFSHRLYLAEAVAAVIEVKSNLSTQWADALDTTKNVHALQRCLDRFSRRVMGGHMTKNSTGTQVVGATFHGPVEFGSTGISVAGQSLTPDRIPVFAVGYTGWNTLAPLVERVQQKDEIDGILVLNSQLFVSGRRAGNVQVSGPEALWAFICALHQATQTLSEIDLDPMRYL